MFFLKPAAYFRPVSKTLSMILTTTLIRLVVSVYCMSCFAVSMVSSGTPLQARVT